MITFKMDFDGDDFRRKMIAQLENGLHEKLRAAGLSEKVKLTINHDGEGYPTDFVLKGSDEDVAKAAKVLGVKEED